MTKTDIISFGIISIGFAGASLVGTSVFSRLGFHINEDAIKLALEATKYGGMLYLLQHLSKLFF